MDENSTRFLHFNEIDVTSTDLVADAFAIDLELRQLLDEFRVKHFEPDDELIARILEAS